MSAPSARHAVLLFALAITTPSRAFAEPPPAAERANVYSPYEQDTIDTILSSVHGVRDVKPEGKTIERIEVVPIDVFEPHQPAPTSDFFVFQGIEDAQQLPEVANRLHATTRRSVIRREMLLREGERYQQTLVDETLRNLRALPQLSLVIVVATEGSSPDRVGLVVITKDVWSLRTSWDILATPGGVEEFDFEPTETNLFGTHQSVRALFVYQPAAYTFGLGYTIPRLEESRIAMRAGADVMVNHSSGAPEGTYGYLIAGQPLYSGLVGWSWDADVNWADIVERRYVNAHLSDYVDPTTGLSVPFQYRSRSYAATYEVTRSFGWETKHDITFAANIDLNSYRALGSGLNPIAVRDFVRDWVPRSDTTVGPSVRYHTYTKRYVRLIDFDTLALQEDYGLGHQVVVSAYPSFRALGASRDVVFLSAAVQYTVALRDGLARVSLTSHGGFEPARIADAALIPWAHLATPTVAGLGRIVVDGGVTYRWRNYLRQHEILGGQDRLRGYPTNFFIGKDSVAYSIEVRSRPIEILSSQLAAVAFYDVADAFNGFENLNPYQSVGFGFRALIPWLDRVVFRGDIGFPLKRPVDAAGALIPPYGFVVSFGQAFTVPSVAPATVLPTEQSEQFQ